MSALSSTNMDRIFAYMEQKRNDERGNAPTLYNRQSQNIVFGEELQGYIPVAPNRIHHSIMERDPLQMVKTLASQITMYYYDGEPKLVDMTASVYSDFLKARKRLGFKGVHGMNAKGIICAILYMIILHRQKSRLDINKLIASANKVKAASKTVITRRMVFKYLSYILSIVDTDAQNEGNGDNTNNYMDKLNDEIKRLCILLRYNTKDIMKVRKEAKLALLHNPTLLEQHNVTTLSIVFVYKYALMKNSNNMNSVKSKLGITPYIISKVFPKLVSVSVRSS
jgi:hypothetical protein